MRSSIAPGFGRLAAAIALAIGACAAAPAAFAQAPSTPAAAPAAAGGPEPRQSDPRRVSTIVEQAGRLHKEGQPADALKMLDDGLKQFPRDPQLRFLYGVILADQRRTADAIDVFEQLSADYPELPEPYNNLAVMHAAAGNLDKARAALENAVRALPGYALAHENLGDLYLRMAARAYERAAGLAAGAAGESPRAKLGLTRELLQRLAPKPAGANAPRTH